ncbi:MAG TPA: hypothetical protein VFQ72_00945, partial [Candidatus Paceibacterota bacterium]|nr:hypothetical protein [Candidatus Paceibacterota bacterium]
MKKHVAVFTIVLSAVAGLFALGFLPRAAEAVSKSEVDASLLPLYNYSPRVAIEYAKGAYAYVNLGGQIFTSDANAPQGASGGNSSRLGFIFKSKVPGTRELRDNEGKRVLGYVFEKEHLNTVPLYKVHDVHYTSAITSKTGELYYYRSDWNDAKDGPFVIGSTEKLDLFLGYIYPQEGVIPENLDETSRGGGCSVSGRAVVCKDVPDGGVCHADGRNPLGDSVPTYECSDSSTCSANTCVPDKGMQKAGQIVSLPSTVTTMGGAPVTVANSGSEAWGMDTYAVGMLRIGVSESPRYYPVSVEAGASAQIWVYPDVEGTYYVFLAVRKSAARAYEPFGDRRTMVVEKGAAGSFPRFSKDVWYEGLKFTWPELNANDLGKNQAMQVRDAVTDRLYFEAPRGEQSAKLGSSIPSGKRLLALAVYDYDKGGVVARGFVTPTVLKDPKAPRLSSLSWNADEPSTWPTLSTDEELPPFVSIGFVDASTGRRYELPQRAQSGTIPVSPKSGQATLKLQTFDDANVLAESTVTVAVSGSAPEAQTGGSVSSVDPSKKLTISSTAWDADDPATWPTISLAGVLPTEVVTVTDMNNNIIARGSAGQSTIKLSRSPQVPDNNYARQTIAVSVDNGPTRVFLQVLPVTVNGHYQVDGKTVSISSFTWSADDPSTWPTVSVGNLGSNEEVRVRDGETFAQIALLTQSKSSMKIASSPSAGKKQVQFLFYKKDSGASNGAMGVLNVTVTSGAAASVSTAPAAAPAQAAQTAPSTTAPSATTAPAASIAAPSLSTTSWYADDPSTWPTVSTPSSLNSNQSIR